MQSKAAATEKKLTNAVHRGEKLNHCIDMRRRRDNEDRDSDSDGEIFGCWVCGRANAEQIIYTLASGGAMCETCLEAEETPPEVL